MTIEPANDSGTALLSQAFIQRVLAGHMRSISRCISLIENDLEVGAQVRQAIDGMAGKATIIGVTGVPGAGKSTLVPALARRMADGGLRPAILAVDPSSPISGGAILGDRIRDSAAAELGLFFRSIASRGSLGGLSRTLDDVVTLLDAAGFDAVLIETVGTGQSEVAITRLAHTTLAVTAPGLGDEVQAMKAGILEVADIVVVNKSDADALGAETAADTIRTVLSLGGRAHGLQEGANFSGEGEALGWLAPVRAVSALKGLGLDELLDLILAHRAYLERSRLATKRLTERRSTRFREALHDALLAEFARARGDELAAMESAVASGERDPISAARELARTIAVAPAPGVPSANRGAA